MDQETVYEGEERRGYTKVYRCDLHSEHTVLLATLARDIEEAKTSNKEAANKIEKKLDGKVALAFLIAFTLAYIIGVLSIYKGVQANRLLMTEQNAELKIELNQIKSDITSIRREIHKPQQKGYAP